MAIPAKHELHMPPPKRGFKPEEGWLVAYTDGGANPNDGSGWGGSGVFAYTHEDVEYGISRALPKGATNNIAELYGFIDAARLAIHLKVKHLAVYPDSSYLISGIEGWLRGWKKNNWKTRKEQPVKNEQLWRRIDKLLIDLKDEGIKLSLNWVKGHNGTYGNEVADTLATQGTHRSRNENRTDVLLTSGTKIDVETCDWLVELDEREELVFSDEDTAKLLAMEGVNVTPPEVKAREAANKTPKKVKYPIPTPLLDSKLVFVSLNAGGSDFEYIYGFSSNKTNDKDRGPLEMVGCHNSTTRLSVVKTDADQPPLREAIGMLTDSVSETVPAAIDWAVLAKKSVWEDICERREKALRFTRGRLRLADATEVARVANPPGRVYMATDTMDTMAAALEEYLEGVYEDSDQIHDLTEMFAVPAKSNFVLNPDIANDATYVDCKLGETNVRLTFGLNLPGRPAIQKLAKQSSTFKVLLLQQAKTSHSYGHYTIIRSDESIGIYHAPYACKTWII